EWSVELRRNVNDDDNVNESARRWRSPGRGASLEVPPELTLADQGQEQNVLSLDANLARPWGESGRLEAGYRASLRTTGDDFLMSADASGDPGAADEAVGDFR